MRVCIAEFTEKWCDALYIFILYDASPGCQAAQKVNGGLVVGVQGDTAAGVAW